MRHFQGMRRPLGGFIVESIETKRRDVQEAETARWILEELQWLGAYMENTMRTVDEILQLVYDQRGQIDSLAALTSGIKQRLQEQLGSVTNAQQSAIDKVFDELAANTAAISKAVKANDDVPDEKLAEVAAAVVGAVSDGPALAEIKSDLGGSADPSAPGVAGSAQG